jgi:hypothetical protein
MNKISFVLMLLFLLTIPIEDSLAISSEFSIKRLIGMVAIGYGVPGLSQAKNSPCTSIFALRAAFIV